MGRNRDCIKSCWPSRHCSSTQSSSIGNLHWVYFVGEMACYKPVDGSYIRQTMNVPCKEMNFTPAEFFDQVDKDEAEMERLNSITKLTITEKVRALRTTIMG